MFIIVANKSCNVFYYSFIPTKTKCSTFLVPEHKWLGDSTTTRQVKICLGCLLENIGKWGNWAKRTWKIGLFRSTTQEKCQKLIIIFSRWFNGTKPSEF